MVVRGWGNVKGVREYGIALAVVVSGILLVVVKIWVEWYWGGGYMVVVAVVIL